MQFEFATATRILFGSGSLAKSVGVIISYGQKALVVTGKNPDRAAPLTTHLQNHDIIVTTFSVAHEPTIELINEGVQTAKANTCDMVISFGGGSVIDAGKAIAALASNEGHPLDYLEVIGKGQPLQNPPLPFVAIPTTAGTGAEVTQNAVLASDEYKVKVSLRSPLMLPKLAVVDPELTLDMPPYITAQTGMDALTQVIEPYTSRLANPITDVFCVEGIKRAASSLKTAFEQGDNLSAREDMALASLLGGLALANAKLGAVHGFAGTLGGMYSAPHGAICAGLLPYATQINVRAMQERELKNPALARYEHVAQLLTGRKDATIDDAINWLTELSVSLDIPHLATYGVRSDDFQEIVEKSSRSSSMKGNPITLEPSEMHEILAMAL